MTRYRIFGIVGVILLIVLALIMVPSKAGATDNCDRYEQHPPSDQYPNGWGECITNPTPIPATATPFIAPTSTPNILPTISTDPGNKFSPPLTSGSSQLFNCGSDMTTNTITVWSVEGEDFVWQVRINDVWYDLKLCDCSDRVHTQVEWRDKFNESTGKIERTSMTRITLTSIMPLNNQDYRVFESTTNTLTGVFTDLNNRDY